MAEHPHDIRWKQRFENLQATFQLLQEAIVANQHNPESPLLQMALIKAFEMTFELSWKTMKDYLNYQGIEVKLPREIIKQAFANEIIVAGELWIEMLEDRNLMTHTYNKTYAQQAIATISQDYLPGFIQLQQFFQDKL